MSKELRKQILAVLLECLEDTRNYPPDDWQYDFKWTVERKLEKEHLES